MAGADPSPGSAEAEARRALDAYPTLMTAGVVFTCLEQVGRRWRILATDNDTPQQARDELAHQLLFSASESDDEGVEAQLRQAADVLDWERRDELTMARRRFRIGRIEKLARLGRHGPEPPRSSDPETVPDGGDPPPRRLLEFIADNSLTGTAAAITRHGLHTKAPMTTTDEEDRDAGRAVQTHQEVVLLAAEFIVAEEIDGRWRQHVTGADATPQAARRRLAHYFRVVVPGPDSPEPVSARAARQLGYDSPGPSVCAEYATAADLVDRERLNDIHVAGRHFRVTRVEQIVRLGPNGPEPPPTVRPRPVPSTRSGTPKPKRPRLRRVLTRPATPPRWSAAASTAHGRRPARGIAAAVRSSSRCAPTEQASTWTLPATLRTVVAVDLPQGRAHVTASVTLDSPDKQGRGVDLCHTGAYRPAAPPRSRSANASGVHQRRLPLGQVSP